MIQLIALGWCFFGEFAALSSLDVGLFCLSILVCVAGVALVAQRPLPVVAVPPPPPAALDANHEAAAEPHDVEPHLDALPVHEALPSPPPPPPPASPVLMLRASPPAPSIAAVAMQLPVLGARAAPPPVASQDLQLVRVRSHCVRADADTVARIRARLGSQRAIELPSPWSTATERRIRAVLA
jgi:hypothetical protein